MSAQLTTPPLASMPFVQTQGRDGSLMLTGPALRFLTNLAAAFNGATDAFGVSRVTLGNGISICSASGNPNGLASGNTGDLYLNLAGGAGTTLYVKESGVPGSKSGWTGK